MNEKNSIFQAMTWIDEKYILEAEQPKKKNIKWLTAAAVIACAILITGTNYRVQAALEGVFSQTLTLFSKDSHVTGFEDLDFSRLPENIQVRQLELDTEGARIYSLMDADGNLIMLIQYHSEEMTLEAEGTITKKNGEFGTYWEIEENGSADIIWEKDGNYIQIAGAPNLEEARTIYFSLR